MRLLWLPLINLFGMGLLFCACTHPKTIHETGSLIRQKKLSYPSASAIEYASRRLFAMGDDAPYLLSMNTRFKKQQMERLYPGEGRLPGATKHDLESMMLLNGQLLVMGSGSRIPTRSFLWLYNPTTKNRQHIAIDSFHQRIMNAGIKALNLEGSTIIDNQILLGNRGSMKYPQNYLVTTSPAFWEHPMTAPIRLINFSATTDSAAFSGISGLYYFAEADQLFVTLSTEYTSSAVADGSIGTSYIGIVHHISQKLNTNQIQADQVINLSTIHPVFAHQKIESLTLIKQTRNKLTFVLAADNDDGSSMFFTVRVNR